ncbi:hypothetical protein [Niallia taxi]|uniref:hypothetical protein n=1 Tax=Niallia taxi TaxID=2499688 RepID=UPI002E1CDF3E|nr:hypothetical protein [Niallia taxi]
MDAIKTVTEFIKAYKEKVNQLNERIEGCNNRIEELQLEVRFMKEKEIPEASIQKVLTGESGLETKLKKKLDKLEAELVEKQEELIIITNALQRYHLQAANELKGYKQAFNDEKAITSQKAYNKMMAAKREYVEAMKKESIALHKYQAIDVQIQLIEQQAGLKKDVYNIFTVNSAPMISHLNRHNNVYLALTHDEVKTIVSNPSTNFGYLDKFKHIKGL